MGVVKDKKPTKNNILNPKKSIQRAKTASEIKHHWSIDVADKKYSWSTRMERVGLIRQGLPYASIEVLSKRADLTVKQFLKLIEVPQTTYNKKKKDKDLLNSRNTETLVVLTELLDFGLNVFNDEKEKFQRWLKKPNRALGGVSPESLFDSLTGIQEVQNCLTRLE
jgi:putative toxin-antitoxin system antitoxin component (TIGR02293 family)